MVELHPLKSRYSQTEYSDVTLHSSLACYLRAFCIVLFVCFCNPIHYSECKLPPAGVNTSALVSVVIDALQ
jgi:hypothetical protein